MLRKKRDNMLVQAETQSNSRAIMWRKPRQEEAAKSGLLQRPGLIFGDSSIYMYFLFKNTDLLNLLLHIDISYLLTEDTCLRCSLTLM